MSLLNFITEFKDKPKALALVEKPPPPHHFQLLTVPQVPLLQSHLWSQGICPLFKSG